MDITTDTIKKLRDLTSVSIMQCKKALEEAGGDLAQAEVILKKQSAATAEKKSERELKAGTIGTYVHDGAIGAMVLLSCETDFVAKNPDFGVLARDLAMQVAATDPKYNRMEHVPTEQMEAAKAVFAKEIEGKPAHMQEKIMEGKIASYFADQVFSEQLAIKDESKKIQDLLNEATQKFGERVEVTRFVRLSSR